MLTLTEHLYLYLGGVWLDVDLRTDTRKTHIKEIGLHSQNVLTVLNSIVNRFYFRGREPTRPFNEKENLHFDNE